LERLNPALPPEAITAAVDEVSDGNAGALHTWFGSTLDAVKTLDWAAIRATDWWGKTHQKSAEFLVADFFPWTGIHAIGCHNSGVARQVEDLISSQHHRPAVAVEPAWYY
jgi:hypothetical protein